MDAVATSFDRMKGHGLYTTNELSLMERFVLETSACAHVPKTNKSLIIAGAGKKNGVAMRAIR